LDANEIDALMDSLDVGHSGSIGKAQLAASQIDWRQVQQNNMPGWLEAVRRCFAELDRDGDGIWSCHEILECLQSKLSPSEVRYSPSLFNPNRAQDPGVQRRRKDFFVL
jgi:hypothetical protein